MEFSGYEDGYSVGWEEGRRVGFDEGMAETVEIYEPRLAKFWAEMQTLNARINYVENLLNEGENRGNRKS